jgi:WD40 repeat protein
MKKPVIIIAIGLALLSACDTMPLELPAETPAPPPAPEPVVIRAENLSSLVQAGSLNPSSQAILCSWSTDGSSFWVQDLNGAYLYDAGTFTQTASYEISEHESIYDLSANGRTIAYSLDGLAISLFDIVDNQEILTITPDYQFLNAFFSPDGSMLGVESYYAIEVVVYDTTTGEEVRRLSGFETAAPVYSARFAADRKTLVWFSRGTVQPMDITNNTMMPALRHEDFVAAFAVAPDGSVIATAAGGTYEGEPTPLITYWHPQDGYEVAVAPFLDYISALAFSPDSSLLAAGTSVEITFLSVPGAEVLASLDSSGISSLVFSPDGTRLLACTREGNATIWKVE